MRLVQAGNTNPIYNRVYFQLVGLDGASAVIGEGGGQPQISINGAAFTNTGIGVLQAIGNGRYYADLNSSVVTTGGTIIETRYKSANTLECPGDTIQVVGFNPNDLLLTPVNGYIGNTLGGAINKINATQIVIASPVISGGDVTIIRGDSYLISENRQLTWTITGLSGTLDFTGSTTVFKSRNAFVFINKPVTTSFNSGTGTLTLTMEFTTSETSNYGDGTTPYDIQTTFADNSIITFVMANLIVKYDVN